MASLMLHIAIGNKYCDIHNIENRSDFINGCIAPDLLPSKEKAHYVFGRVYDTYREAIEERVDLFAYAKVNAIVDDYTRGYALHMFTDYIFYNQYMANLDTFKQIEHKDMKVITADVYKEYDRVAYWIKNEYMKDLNTDILPPYALNELNEPMQIFSKEGLEKVIDICANLNVEEVAKLIKEGSLFSLKYEF